MKKKLIGLTLSLTLLLGGVGYYIYKKNLPLLKAGECFALIDGEAYLIGHVESISEGQYHGEVLLMGILPGEMHANIKEFDAAAKKIRFTKMDCKTGAALD